MQSVTYNIGVPIPFILSLLFIIFLLIISTVLIYRKAGLGGWEVFIPIYSYYCMFRIANLNPLLMLLMIIPIANIFMILYLQYRVFRCFGVSTGLSIMFTVFSIIGIPLVALSNEYQYEGSY